MEIIVTQFSINENLHYEGKNGREKTLEVSDEFEEWSDLRRCWMLKTFIIGYPDTKTWMLIEIPIEFVAEMAGMEILRKCFLLHWTARESLAITKQPWINSGFWRKRGNPKSPFDTNDPNLMKPIVECAYFSLFILRQMKILKDEKKPVIKGVSVCRDWLLKNDYRKCANRSE